MTTTGTGCITGSAIADRIARDLAAADRGEASPDYVLLGGSTMLSPALSARPAP